VHLALVIPVYNEAERLREELLDSLFEELAHVQVIFVDDGSTDATKDKLLQYESKKNNKNIKIISLQKNSGKAEAVRQGFNQVEKDCLFVAFTDGDFATPPKEMARILKSAFELNCDALLGVRNDKGNGRIETVRYRKFQGLIFNFFVKNILGLDLKDPQCGMKVFKNSEILKKITERPFLNPWLIDLEMILRWVQLDPRVSIVEVDLLNWKHQSKSKVKIKDPILMLKDLLRMRKEYLTGDAKE